MWAGCANGVAIIAQMGLIAWLVQQAVIERTPMANLLPVVLLLLAAIGARALTQAWQETRGHLASERVRQAVRQALMTQWGQLGPVRLASDSHAGIASQMVEQVEALDGYYARFLPQMVICVVVPFAILITAFWLDWLAAIFLLLAAPLIPIFMALVGMGAEKLNQQHFVLIRQLAGHFIDRVRGITTLKLFGQAEHAAGQVTAGAQRYRTLNMRTLRVAFLSSAVLEFFASVAIAVVAIYIGFGLLGYIDYGPSPQLTLFTGLFVLLLAPEFFQPLRQLAQHYHDRAAALGAADSLIDFLQTPVPATNTRVATGSPNAVVVLEAVTAAYSGRGEVLSATSLTIAAGETLALAGPSGSGKSTLLHLMAGFIQPEQGRIRVLNDVPGQQPVAWLDQRPCLLFGSWADNLRLTAPDATEKQLLWALSQAGLDSVLATQPQGLATPLGEGGRGLSGGQLRRLALARVFLSDAPLVLLDEPTTGLDRDSENAVIAGLERLAKSGRALVIATHHQQLLAAADRVLTLPLSPGARHS